MKPEDRARVDIDRQLTQAAWAVQDPNAVDLHAARGVAVREFPLVTGHGKADYLLDVDPKAVGAVEAKKAGSTLSAVEIQAAKYSEGLPATLPAAIRPLPFLYQATGVETRFTSLLDPDPRNRCARCDCATARSHRIHSSARQAWTPTHCFVHATPRACSLPRAV
jgi:type I restriction enzyme R subunit